MRSTRTSSSTRPGLLPRASSTTSPTSAVSSSSSARMSARSAARSSSGSRSASSIVWMFARRLAIGVRSSWLASATRWRCASTERSSASSVALKLRASRASSSSPVAAIRSTGSGLPAISSVRRVKRWIGASAARATSAPRPAARAMPAAATIASTTRMSRSEWSTSVSGRATCSAPLRDGSARVSTRRCVSATLRAGERLAGARARDRARLRGDGQAGRRAFGSQDRPVGADDLRVALRAAEARVVAIGAAPGTCRSPSPAPGTHLGGRGRRARARALAGRRRSAGAAAP